MYSVDPEGLLLSSYEHEQPL